MNLTGEVCWNAETNVAAQGAPSQARARFSGADENQGGTQGPQGQAAQGAPQPVGIAWSAPGSVRPEGHAQPATSCAGSIVCERMPTFSASGARAAPCPSSAGDCGTTQWPGAQSLWFRSRATDWQSGGPEPDQAPDARVGAGENAERRDSCGVGCRLHCPASDKQMLSFHQVDEAIGLLLRRAGLVSEAA